MLTEKQIGEIKEHLERAQNPLFFYDNDADGLCSFVLLRRFIGRGKGVAVRSYPDLDVSYARKAQELNADYVFVLDKPVISEEFIEEVDRLGIPMVWIDHHDIPSEEFEKKFKNLSVYNPARNTGKEKSEEPVTYWSYKITERKEDVWLAVIGCIADHYFPDFFGEFSERYGELSGMVSEPFEAYYKTEIGRIAQALNFGLKDSISNVVRMQNFLISVKGPDEIFAELPGNYAFRKRHSAVRKKYDDLLSKAKESIDGNLIFFDYGGELSISADISNELSFLYSDKIIAVAFIKGEITNMSLRGKNVRGILERVLKKVDGGGGGHEDAVGARISTKDIEKFKEALKEEI